MATRSSLGESALHDDLGIQQNRKFTKPVGIILAVWFLAMASLLGVHYFLKRKPRANNAGILKIQAKYNTLSDEDKTKIKYFEAGIIELANGDLFVVEGNLKVNDQNLAGGNREVWRKIEFFIDDPLLLERETMTGEAVKTLNNAEKRCLTDGRAAIIYEDGGYYLVVDPKIYADYVLRYGTECVSCEKKVRESTNLKKRRKER